MTTIKMLRTTSDGAFIGDRTYKLADVAADAMIKNGDAVLVERFPDPAPEQEEKAPEPSPEGGQTGNE